MRFPARYQRRGIEHGTAMPVAAALPPFTPFYTIADWAIDFTDSVHPPFRMGKAIAQKSPLGILGVTQNKALAAPPANSRGRPSAKRWEGDPT